MHQARRKLRSTFVVAALVASVCSASGPKPVTELEKILYDMGVVGYCGLGSDQVTRGYRRQLGGILERDNIDEKTLNEAIARAWTMVEWEWNNRGLGGFRGWCKTEGADAVTRFTTDD